MLHSSRSRRCGRQTLRYQVKDTMYDFETVLREVKNSLPQKRFEHTLGVVQTAEKMAEYYSVDVDKARIAALLHDCSKGLSLQTMELLSGKSQFEDNYPNETVGTELLHASASEVLAAEKYGITDTDVLAAIRWHTTGIPHMDKLACIIYSADMIEPNRIYDGVEELRNLTFKGLRILSLKCCEHTVKYLMSQNKHVHGATIDFYLYLQGESD